MGKYSKLRERIHSGISNSSIEFTALRQLLARLSFDERVKGSHHIFTKEEVEEIINIQAKGSRAKPY